MRYKKGKLDGELYEKLICEYCFMEIESVFTGLPYKISKYRLYKKINIGNDPLYYEFTCYLCGSCRNNLANDQIYNKVRKNKIHNFKLKVLDLINKERGWEKLS